MWRSERPARSIRAPTTAPTRGMVSCERVIPEYQPPASRSHMDSYEATQRVFMRAFQPRAVALKKRRRDRTPHAVSIAHRTKLRAKTGVGFAVVEEVTDSVHAVLEDGGDGEHEDPDLGIDERDGVQGGHEAGQLAGEGQVFERFHAPGFVSTSLGGFHVLPALSVELP